VNKELKIAISIDPQTKGLNVVKNELNSVNNSSTKLNTTLNSTSGGFKSVDANTQKFTTHLSENKSMLGATTSHLTQLGLALGSIVSAKSALSVAGEYNDKLARLGVISRATSSDLEAFRATSEKIATSTKYNSSQVVDAMNYLAMAGFGTKDVLASVNDVVNLSIAGQLDLAKASDIASDVLSMFGMKASEMGRLTDVMSATIVNSNTNVEQLGEAFKNVGSVAKSVGLDIETTSSILGVLADNGNKGAEAGTHLKIALQRFTTNSEAHKAFEKIGVKVFDANGNMRDMVDILKDVDSKTKILNVQTKSDIFKNLFGEEAITSGTTILGNLDKIVAKQKEAYDSTGRANDIAKNSTTDYTKALDSLNSTFYETQKVIGEQLMPVATSLMQTTTSLLATTKDFIKDNGELVDILMMGASAYLGLKVASVGVNVATKANIISLGLYNSALATSTKATKGATSATKLFNKALKANPIGLAIAGFSAISGAISIFKPDILKASDNTEKFGEEIKKATTATQEMKKELTATEKIEKYNTSLANHNNIIARYTELIEQTRDNDKLSDDAKQNLIATYERVIQKHKDMKDSESTIVSGVVAHTQKTKILTKAQDDYIKKIEERNLASKSQSEQLEAEYQKELKHLESLNFAKEEYQKQKLILDEYYQSKKDEIRAKELEDENRQNAKRIELQTTTLADIQKLHDEHYLSDEQKELQWYESKKAIIEANVVDNKKRVEALVLLDKVRLKKSLELESSTYDDISTLHNQYYKDEKYNINDWYNTQKQKINDNIKDEEKRADALQKLDSVTNAKRLESLENTFGVQAELTSSFNDLFTGKIKNAGDFFSSFTDGIKANFFKSVSEIASKQIIMGFTNAWSGNPNTGAGFVEKFLGIDIPFLNFAQGTIWGDGKYGVVSGHSPFSGDDIRNDTIPALISAGEAVIPKSAVEANKDIVASLISGARVGLYNKGVINQRGEDGLARFWGGFGGFFDDVLGVESISKSLRASFDAVTGKVFLGGLPAMKETANILLQPAMKGGLEAILKNPELGWLVQAVIAVMMPALIPAMLTADLMSTGMSLAQGNGFSEAFKGAGLSGALAGAGGAVTSLINTGAMPTSNMGVWKAIKTYPDTLMNDVTTGWGNLKDSFTKLTDIKYINEQFGTSMTQSSWDIGKKNFLEIGDTIAEWGLEKFDAVKEFVFNPSKMFENIMEGMSDIVSNISTSITSISGSGFMDNLSSYGLNSPKPLNLQDMAVPFAEGGIVTKPTLGLVGEAGYSEAIVPLKDNNAINVNTPALEAQVREVANKLDKVIDGLANLVDIKNINLESLRVAKDTQVDSKLQRHSINSNLSSYSINTEGTISQKFDDINELLQVAIVK
jgi:TP901 family phage tail tape measure protein